MIMRKITTLGIILSLAFVGCGDDDGEGTDTGAPDTSTMADTSTGEDTGMTEDTGGTDAVVEGFNFRTDPADSYERTDRMGMPAVSTAFLGGMKAEYNADSPVDDNTDSEVPFGEGFLPKWAPVIANGLGSVLAGDGTEGNGMTEQLATLELTTCEDTEAEVPFNALPCAVQTVGEGGPTVLSLVIPDTLSIDTEADAGFPNGRRLADQAMDITLAVVLLDLTMHPADTFAALPLNPVANDVEFNAEFPYLADAQ